MVSLNYNDSLLVIPARLDSVRLPGKILKDINGEIMIMRTYNQALKVLPKENIIIACCCEDVKKILEERGVRTIITDPLLQSGSDRVCAVLDQIDHSGYKYIVNLQGDLPNISSDIIKNTIDAKRELPDIDILTAVIKCNDMQKIKEISTVKAIISEPEEENWTLAKALYFERSIPYGEGNHYYHVGIYVYNIDALKKFVSLKPSYLEKRCMLEQLRALENGMSIYVRLCNSDIPVSVDTQNDLELARSLIK